MTRVHNCNVIRLSSHCMHKCQLPNLKNSYHFSNHLTASRLCMPCHAMSTYTYYWIQVDYILWSSNVKYLYSNKYVLLTVCK